jgi:hypothetical protein
VTISIKIEADDKLSGALNKVQGELKQTGTEADKAGDKLEKAGDKAKEAGDDVKKAGDKIDKAGDQIKSAGDKSDKFGSKLKGVTTSIGSFAKQIGVMGAAVGVGFAVVSKLSNDFDAMDDAMSVAVGTTGKTREELDLLAKSFQDASDQSLTYTQSLQILTKGVQTGSVGIADMANIVAISNVKAKQTGQDTEAIANQITEAITKGSTEQLVSLGLLDQGLEGVRAGYDKTAKEGVGSFDKLSESQRKLIIGQAALKNAADIGEIMKETGVVGSDGMDEFNRSIMDAYKSLTEVAGSSDFKVFLSDIAKGINDYAVPAIESIPTAINGVMTIYQKAVDAIAYTISWFGETLRILPEGTTKAVEESAKAAEEAKKKALEQARVDAAEQKKLQDEASKKIAEQQAARKQLAEDNKKWEAEQKELLKQATLQEKLLTDQVKKLAEEEKARWEAQKARYAEELAKLEAIKAAQGERVKNTRSFLKDKSSDKQSSQGTQSTFTPASAPTMDQAASVTSEQTPTANKGNSFAESLAGFGVFNMGGEFGSNGMMEGQGAQEQGNLVDQLMGKLKRSDVLKALARTNNITTQEASRQLNSGKLTDKDFINAQYKAVRDQISKDAGNVEVSKSDIMDNKDVLKALGKDQGLGGSAKDIEAIRANVRNGVYSDEQIQSAYRKFNKPKLNQRQASALQDELKDRQSAAINELEGNEDYGQISSYVKGNAKAGSAGVDDLGESQKKQEQLVDSQKTVADKMGIFAKDFSNTADKLTDSLNNIDGSLTNVTQRVKDLEKLLSSVGKSTASTKAASASREF